MTPLLVNTSDVKGGAAGTTYRLHRGFREIGVNSKMLVQSKVSDDIHVIEPQPRLDVHGRSQTGPDCVGLRERLGCLIHRSS